MKNKLLNLRKQLDQIDRKILKLFAKRFKVTEQVGLYKVAKNLPIQDVDREQRQMEKIKQLAMDYKVNPEFAQKFLRVTIDQVLKNHQAIKDNN